MVARNRFLAESMLNGYHSKPKSPMQNFKKYSVPTCHSTLKQMEQARLAKEFEEQRKGMLSRTSSVGKLVSNFEHGQTQNGGSFINNNNYYNEETGPTVRTSSPSPVKPPLAAKPMLRHTVSV